MPEPNELISIGVQPAPRRRKRRRFRWEIPITVAAVGVILLGGVTVVGVLKDSHARPQAGASPSASPSAPVDAHAKKACELNEQAADQVKLNDVPTVQAILAEAKQSTDADVHFRAQMLADEQEISNAAIARNSGDAELELAAFNASLEMTTTCIKKGYVVP